jgi:hypothetical protein
MNFLKTLSVLVVGFLLGLLFRPGVTNAQVPKLSAPGARPIIGVLHATETYNTIPWGNRVIGFSCVREETSTQCYYAVMQ